MTGINRVILADDHTVLREELRSILENNGEFQIAGEAGNGVEVLSLLNQGIVPDALVLDLMMPKMSGIEALVELRRMGFSFPVLVLTMQKAPEFLCHAFQAGADGYMLKDAIAKELIAALHTVLAGGVYLSPSIKGELPETCRLAPCAGEPMPGNFVHCR